MSPISDARPSGRPSGSHPGRSQSPCSRAGNTTPPSAAACRSGSSSTATSHTCESWPCSAWLSRSAATCTGEAAASATTSTSDGPAGMSMDTCARCFGAPRRLLCRLLCARCLGAPCRLLCVRCLGAPVRLLCVLMRARVCARSLRLRAQGVAGAPAAHRPPRGGGSHEEPRHCVLRPSCRDHPSPSPWLQV